MNCRPGDLAIVVGGDGYGIAGEISHKMIGKIVRVKHLRAPIGDLCSSLIVWAFDQPYKMEHRGKTYTIFGCADAYLRPIRDPGDDAKDEMLHPLPKEVEA